MKYRTWAEYYDTMKYYIVLLQYYFIYSIVKQGPKWVKVLYFRLEFVAISRYFDEKFDFNEWLFYAC